MTRVTRFLIAVLVVGLAAAAMTAVQRQHTESRNKKVQIILDWTDLRTMSYGSGNTYGKLGTAGVLRRLRAHGVRGLAVSETNLGELRDTGRVFPELDPLSAPESPRLRIAVPDHALAEQIVANLNAKCGGNCATLLQEKATGPVLIQLRDSFELVKSVGVGFPPEALNVARKAGVEVIGRVGGYPGINPAGLEWLSTQMEHEGIRTVVFNGVEIPGNKEFLPDLAASLQRHHIQYGFVEFGKQKGDTALAKLLQGELVRVHSITDAEMGQLTPPEAIDRFTKAARERDIRVIYARLFPQPTADLLGTQNDYLDSLVRGLKHVGLTVGPAHPYLPLHTNRLLLILTGAGVIAGTVLLLGRLLSLTAGMQMQLFLIGLLCSTALLGLPPTLNHGRKLLALLAAIVFPTLALLRFGDPTQERGARRSAATLFLLMSATTLAGALLVVGLLGDTSFLVKYDAFAGIKAAHLLPILALAVFLAGDVYSPAISFRDRWDNLKAHIRQLLAEPMYLWQIVGMAVAMAFLLVLLLRTGNDPGVGVSPLELKFRALMDRLLYVRPRTKEFLIGHPAMLLALWAGLRGNRRLWLPAILLGSIGQVSLLNTFCHIHTPLMVSLLRAANGLVLGMILGAVVIYAAQRLGADARFEARPKVKRAGGAR